MPGRIQTACSCAPTSRTDTDADGVQVRPGALRTTTSTSTTTNALPAAALENATDQPAACSSAANGIADSTCPSWPKIVVSWVNSGTRLAGNQRGISASTATKTMASPVPTSTRAGTATGTADGERQQQLAADQQRAADHQHGARAEAVDHQAGRDLRRRRTRRPG